VQRFICDEKQRDTQRNWLKQINILFLTGTGDSNKHYLKRSTRRVCVESWACQSIMEESNGKTHSEYFVTSRRVY